VSELPLVQRVIYSLFPVPILLSWFRWNYARYKYLGDINKKFYHTPADLLRHLEMIVEAIWDKYYWCWPKPWMRKWFANRLNLTLDLLESPAEFNDERDD